MYKRMEATWNAHTPAILHPRTKENIIFQLTLTAALIVGLGTYDWWKDRQERKRFITRLHN